MIDFKDIDEFLEDRDQVQLVDVRSPDEFAKGHILGAVNIPLLDNEDRITVGTLYKQKGRVAAVARAFELLSPKAESLHQAFKKMESDRSFHLYCWRGGMRSESVAWMLDKFGYRVAILKGGYKAYRKHLTSQILNSNKLLILAGYTGSAKTDILMNLKKKGEQVVDLEDLASHRGSVFGKMNVPQPESELFNNRVGEQFRSLDPEKVIWIEDESLSIGKVYLSHELYSRIQNSPWVMIDIPQTERIQYLKQSYDHVSEAEVDDALNKISKRMGGQNVTATREAMKENNKNEVIRNLLNYYDKAYSHSLRKKSTKALAHKNFNQLNIEGIAEDLISWKKNQNW